MIKLTSILIVLSFVAFAQPDYLSPEFLLESRDSSKYLVIKKVFHPRTGDPILVFEKSFYEDGGVSGYFHYDLDKREKYYHFYSDDSLSYQHRIEDRFGKADYRYEFTKEEGLIIKELVTKQVKGKNIYFDVHYNYKKDDKNRVVEMVAKSLATHLKKGAHKQKIKFAYTAFDSLESVVEYEFLYGTPMEVKRVEHQYNNQNKRTQTTTQEKDYQKKVNYLYDDYGRLEEKQMKNYEDSVVIKFEYDENNKLKIKTQWVYNPAGVYREAYYFDKEARIQVHVERNDSMVYDYFKDGSLHSIELFNTLVPVQDQKPVFLKKVTRDSQLRIVEISELIRNGNQYVRFRQYFKYNEKGRLIQFNSEKILGKDALEEIVKKYKYTSSGQLFQVDVLMPLISYHGIFVYEYANHP